MQVALGLGYLHSKNVIYRDLKPENVLVGEDGYVLICDFGISKMIDPAERELAYDFIGTPEYMAPEILNSKAGKRGYDFAVDWWALGTLMYELLIGIPPFYHHNQHRMVKMIRKKPFKFPDLEELKNERGIIVSDKAKDLIEKFLVKDPNGRIGSSG